MKFIGKLSLVMIILLLTVSCNTLGNIKDKETLGNLNEISDLLPDRKATWIYKGTGVYYHKMTLDDIISSDQSVYYKIKGEILSDERNSNYNDYLTEIRYIVSRKGWQQELKQSKLLDSKYKGMYLLKFPIEENNTWQEKVLDFQDKEKIIIGKIESINTIDGEKVIVVKYNEKNSDYYEIRKIKQGNGVVEFEKNVEINNESHILRYSLDDFYYNDEGIEYEIKTFLTAYNKAWEAYYNNDESKVFNFIDKDSALVSNILAFEKTDNTEINFIDLLIKSVSVDENQYQIEAQETFSVINGQEQYIQRNLRKYILIKFGENFKILKIE